MSFVDATPEYVAAAASDLEKIGTAINYANSAASGATSAIQAAGADAVSASISHLFGVHAAAYQAISAQAALFHNQFVQLMSGGAQQYADTEVVNAMPLQAGPQAVLGAANHALSGQQPGIVAAAQAGGVASGVPAAAAPSAAAPAPVAAPAAAPAAATVTPMAATTTAAGAGSTTPHAAPHGETPAYAAGAAPVAAIPAAAAATATDVSAPAAAAVAPADVAAAELSSATMLPAAMPTPSNGPATPPPPAPPKGRPPTPSR